MSSEVRLMTPAQRDRRIAGLEGIIAALRALPVATPCAECLHFNKATGFCDVWKTTVPEAAREKGCDRWEEDLPF